MMWKGGTTTIVMRVLIPLKRAQCAPDFIHWVEASSSLVSQADRLGVQLSRS